MVRTSRVFGIVVALYGCGSHGARPDAATTSDAAVDAAPDAPRPPMLVWTPCDGRFECSTLTVPVSYDDPSLGTFDLVALRWPAEAPSARIGTVFIAPGGPGQAGTTVLKNFVSGVNPAMGEVLRRFDLVTLDLRGTGASGPIITCVDDTQRLEAASLAQEAADDSTVDTLVDTALAGCTTSATPAVISHLDTASTAHDIDRFREALGESSISILGQSYGTWVAAVYGATFPTRLRGAVLGSVVSGDLLDRAEATIRGTQLAAEAFTDWCDATPTCAFRPTDGTTTMAALTALAASLRAAPLTGGGRTLHAAELGAAVRGLLYAPDYLSVARILAAARAGDPIPALTSLEAFYTATVASAKDSHTVIYELDHLLDHATGLAAWRDRLPALQADAPLYTAFDGGDRQLDVRIAVRWPYPPDHPVTSVASPTAPPYFVVAGQLDPVTPSTGAAALVQSLGNGSQLIASNALGHSGVPGPCSQARATLYLLDPTAPIDTSPCTDRRIGTDQTVVGAVTAAFVWDAQSSRRAETGLGDFVADAMRTAASADVAVINGGGLRAGLPASTVHPVSMTLRRPDAGYAAGPPYDLIAEDAHAVLPFGNRIATVNVTGRELWKLLEFAVSQWTSSTGSGPFLQVSGIRFAFNGNAAPGSRVSTVTRTDGTPIPNDDTVTFVLALPDYVYYGGTSYYDLAEHSAQVGGTMEAALAGALQAGPPVTFATDGRIALAP